MSAGASPGAPRKKRRSRPRPSGSGRSAEDRDRGAVGRQRGQGHAAQPGLVGLDAGEQPAERGRRAQERGRGPGFIAPRRRAASRFCLARLPHTSISHHRRPLFLLVSQKSQPQAWPSQRLMRAKSPSVNSFTADERDRAERRLDRAASTLQRPSAAPVAAASVARGRQRA